MRREVLEPCLKPSWVIGLILAGWLSGSLVLSAGVVALTEFLLEAPVAAYAAEVAVEPEAERIAGDYTSPTTGYLNYWGYLNGTSEFRDLSFTVITDCTHVVRELRKVICQ